MENFCQRHNITSFNSFCAICLSEFAAQLPESDQIDQYEPYQPREQDLGQHIMMDIEEEDVPANAALKTITLKCPLSAIGWRPEFFPNLQALVLKVDHLTRHTYLLARYIFVQELHADVNFDIESCMDQDFFAEVFVSLVDRRPYGRVSVSTRARRNLIERHIRQYVEITGFRRMPTFGGLQQVSLYQGKAVATAYLNTVENDFGNQLRRIVNRLLDVKERAEQKKQVLLQEGIQEEEVSRRLRSEINQPATNFKLAIARRRPRMQPNFPEYIRNAFQQLEPILLSYPDQCRFQSNSIYCDSKVAPIKHVKTYYLLARFCEQSEIKSFQAFPLRSSWVPGYMQIDTRILRQYFLNDNNPHMANKLESWRGVVDLQARAFQPQGDNSSLKFRGSIYTDGVGVSIIKSNQEKRAGGPRIHRTMPASEARYITDLSNEDLQETIGRAILIDPNRRDLIYCMHEYSTVHDKQTFRWTKNSEAKITKERKLRKLAEEKKPQEIQEAEALLSELTKSSVTPNIYINYLLRYVELAPVMLDHYGNILTEAELPVPFHLKVRLQSTVNKNKADDMLANKLRNQFGEDALLVMGDWSGPNQKYHEPIRGKGLQNALRHRGFHVVLLDEFRTSKVCPSCQQPSLKTFKSVGNPRSWRRHGYPTVTCHNLLKCNNEQCMQTMAGTHRVYNRNLASVLNYRHILHGLRTNGVPPSADQRPR